MPASKSAVGWFSEGEVITVLAFSGARNEEAKILLWSGKQQVSALFPTSEFSIVDNRLPRSWVVKSTSEGFFSLAPESWHREDFWEMFYEDNPEAIKIFEYEKKRLSDESN
ncbi:hypothetical protein D3C71_1896250 [compost metagenome]